MGILALLKFAPAMLSAGLNIFEAVSGKPVAKDTSPENLANHIDTLPVSQQVEITQRLTEAKVKIQGLDTRRFLAMADGDAEKLRASARPEIALRAMAVIEVFSKTFMLLMSVTVAEWAARLVSAANDWKFPDVSLWALVAQAAPVTTMIWPPLLASFAACVTVITKYMGARERDKAQQFEMQAGRPLQSAAATVAAAGGNIANIINAIRGK